MKNTLKNLLLALVVVLIGLTRVNAASDDIVKFNDANLKYALLEYDTNNDYELQVSEMEKITYLYLYGLDIRDITGLEYATNLTRLGLGYSEANYSSNEISDISVLKNLTKLTYLDLSYNDVEDISALSNLTNLTILDLCCNNIENISELSNLTNLTYLDLSENYGLTDISALSKLRNLTSLSVGVSILVSKNDIITNISPLANLTNLQYLNLYNCNLANTTALSNLTNLETLDFIGTDVLDLNFLKNLKNLRALTTNNQLTNISALSQLTNIARLNLTTQWDYEEILDLNFLIKLIKLQELNLGGRKITNTNAISKLPKLSSLNLISNGITDISFLSNLTNLRELNLSENNIENIGVLSNLSELYSLDLSFNKITDILPLSVLTNLSTLDLSNNYIEDFSSIRGLNIDTLNIDNQTSRIDISNFTVSGITDKVFNGTSITQNVVVKVGTKALTNGTDYTVSYKNNKNKGTATLTITGKGIYKGSIVKTFKINPFDLSKITISGITNKMYTGKAITQNVTLKTGNTTLVSGTDYTVTYKNNQNPGTATITITGKGNYTGTINKTFSIIKTNLSYQTGVQSKGWLEKVPNGEISGTTGSGLRMEALKINLENQEYIGNVEYRSHVQKTGWEKTWKKNGEMSGTQGQSLRLEAIQIRLTGEMAKNYDIYYRIHVQRFGWLDWTKNGASAGTAGFGFRVEAIQIKLVKKGSPAPGKTTRPYVSFDNTVVSYQTQVQKKGWLSNVNNGVTSGTVGSGLRMEGLKIKLQNQGFTGNIEYRTHIQKQGWESTWKKNGELSGTQGQGLRLEALQLRLTGNMAKEYDIYYRVHAQKFGWLGWAKNGESAGTAGYGYRLEAIQIVLVRKGMTPPGVTANHYYSK